MYFALRTGSTASDLADRSARISYLYGEISNRVIALDGAVGQTRLAIPDDEAGRIAFATDLRSRAIAQGSRAAPEYFAQVPSSMRVALARADDQISDLQNALLEFGSLLELNRVAAAQARRPTLDSLVHALEANLSDAQRQGLSELLARADDLHEIGRFGIKAVILWLLLGTPVFALILWLLWRRVDRPLRNLEAGLARVATGDLGVRLPVAYADELGRLTEHFNRMTGVLHHRAQEQGRFVAAGELIAGIAHEVNNPLMAVTAMVSNRLADNTGLTPDLREELQQVLRQSHRAGKLVSGLLRFVRGGAEGASDFSLDAVVRDAIELVAHRFPVEEIQLQYIPSAGGVRTRGNPDKIEQVLVNVLSNAADALREIPVPRTIRVESSHAGGTTILAIEDNGPGIPDDLLARLFHPFVSSKGAKGNGLGLYISREIARAAGGDVTLDRSRLGGARFVLSLPVASVDAPAPTTPKAVTIRPDSSIRGLSILVVDDETAVRSPISRFLRRRGAEVIEAEDGVEALAKIARHRFDVIVADVRMPRMDGPALYRRIQRSFPAMAGKVLFLSGDVSQLSGLELGGENSGRIILKPVELATLEDRIADLALAASAPSDILLTQSCQIVHHDL